MRKTINLTLTAAVLGTALLLPAASASAATAPKAAVALTASVDCDRYWSTTSALRVRTGPGTSYATKGQLGYHNLVDVIDVSYNSKGIFTGWYKVRLLATSTYGLAKGTTGWVSASYLAYHSSCYTSIDV